MSPIAELRDLLSDGGSDTIYADREMAVAQAGHRAFADGRSDARVAAVAASLSTLAPASAVAAPEDERRAEVRRVLRSAALDTVGDATSIADPTLDAAANPACTRLLVPRFSMEFSSGLEEEAPGRL